MRQQWRFKHVVLELDSWMKLKNLTFYFLCKKDLRTTLKYSICNSMAKSEYCQKMAYFCQNVPRNAFSWWGGKILSFSRKHKLCEFETIPNWIWEKFQFFLVCCERSILLPSISTIWLRPQHQAMAKTYVKGFFLLLDWFKWWLWNWIIPLRFHLSPLFTIGQQRQLRKRKFVKICNVVVSLCFLTTLNTQSQQQI